MKKIIFILYGLFLLSLTLFSYSFVDHNLIYYQKLYTGFAFNNRGVVSVLYVVFVILFFLFYFLIIKLINEKIIVFKEIKYLVGFTCLFLLFSYPAMLSYDIFNYVATANVLFHYHENPYLIMPIAFIGDPLLLFTHAANKVALYGPAWIVISGLPFLLGIGNFFMVIINLKLTVIIFYLLTIFILWKFTKSLLAISLFAFNPLVIIEILVSGHNDIVMMFFALFSLYLVKQKKIFLAIVFMFLSIFIKYASIFLLPVFVYLLIQNYHKREIVWEKIFLISSISMFSIFLLSPLREEMYPWYAIWFLTFSLCLPKVKLLLYFSIALSFGLMLRYLPFMYLGTYFGITPIARILLTIIPIFILCLYGLFKLNKHKKYEKNI